MEVILKKDVEHIGKAGAVVKVKDGFARNYLIPGGLAVLVNSQNLKKLEEENKSRQLNQEKLKKAAEDLRGRINALSLTIPVLSQEEDKLYGSIGPQEITGALKDEGIEIDKGCIVMDEPIKALGIYEVELKLHPDVPAKLKIWIVKK
jgi:large subunit ribosomal protein L9